MRRDYMAFCKCGGMVAIAKADTPAEQADCAKDVRRWLRGGLSVELRERGKDEPMPAWCSNTKPGTCNEEGK